MSRKRVESLKIGRRAGNAKIENGHIYCNPDLPEAVKIACAGSAEDWPVISESRNRAIRNYWLLWDYGEGGLCSLVLTNEPTRLQ